MVIYAAVLLTILTIFSLYAVREEGKRAIPAIVIGLALELPIYGRIFGWW